MKEVIGFTNVYYTLWNYEAIPQYRSDAYGNHHQCGVEHKYYYIKNVSVDLTKVKSLHPTLEIDESIRGKYSNFVRNEIIDLPSNIFWGGKYVGKLIDEILQLDFKYCLWAMENFNQVRQYVSQHSIYLEYLHTIEKEKNDIINSSDVIKIGDEIEVYFESNGYNPDEDYTSCVARGKYGDVEVVIFCNGAKLVSGLYPYLMPFINGKAQRTKGKTIMVKVLEVIVTNVEFGKVKQEIKIA